MLNSGNKVHHENTRTSSDTPQLPQYLPLDPITLESQSYSITVEVPKVLGFPLTGLSRDHSLVVPQLKTTPPSVAEKLKHLKGSVQNDSSNARDRAKMLKELIVKLNRFSKALNSKKRKRSETSQKSGVVRTAKAGSLNLKIPKHVATHGSEDKSEKVMMTEPIQISLANVQQTKNDRDIGNSTTIGNDARMEKMSRRLLAGGEGLDQKVKKKSVGAAYNRDISAGGEKKHDSLPKLSTNTKFRSVASQGIRLKPMPGVSGIKHASDQKSATLLRENMPAPNLRAIAKANDRSNTQEVYPASNPNANVKGKVSKASCTSTIMELDLSVVHPPSACSDASTQLMPSWTQKSSRLRGATVLPPISRKIEVPDSSQGSPTTSSFVQTTTSEHACTIVYNVQEFSKESDIASTTCQLPTSVGSGARENETIDKGTRSRISHRTTRRSGSATFQMNKNKANGSGGDAQELGNTGADSSSRKPGVPSIKKKLKNLPLTKPQQITKHSDKGRSKSDRPPVTKQGHRFQSQVGQKPLSPTDLTERFNDNLDELLAANSAFNASSLTCSDPLWKTHEDLFQECNADDNFLSISHSWGETGSDHVMEASTGALSEKGSMQRLEKAIPLYKRVLSALIEEDDAGEPSQFGEIRSMPLQYASDDSFCDSCNQIAVELKERDRMHSEVEPEVDLQNQKIYLDRFFGDKSVTSNTIRNPNMLSSLQSAGFWHGDTDCSHSEITHNSEIYSCNIDRVPKVDSNLPVFSSTEIPHQLMSLENRLLVELHSIGLNPENLPDLFDGEEAIKEDNIKIQNRLHQQACRSDVSKNAAHKDSKQVALRTLGRCKRYEETGSSCFDDLALQSILSSSSIADANHARSSDYLGSATTCNKGITALRVEARESEGTVSIPTEIRESHGDNLDGGLLESNEGFISSSELLFSAKESSYDKERREAPTKDAIDDSRVSTLGGTKRKRSKTDKHRRRDHTKSTALSIANDQLPVESNQNGRIGKRKLKQKDDHAKNQSRLTLPTNKPGRTGVNPSKNIDVEGKQTGHGNSKDTELRNVPGSLSLPVLDTMGELDAANGLDGHQDLGSWLSLEDDDGLLENDSLGLAIPMDDLSEVPGINL